MHATRIGLGSTNDLDHLRLLLGRPRAKVLGCSVAPPSTLVKSEKRTVLVQLAAGAVLEESLVLAQSSAQVHCAHGSEQAGHSPTAAAPIRRVSKVISSSRWRDVRLEVGW